MAKSSNGWSAIQSVIEEYPTNDLETGGILFTTDSDQSMLSVYETGVHQTILTGPQSFALQSFPFTRIGNMVFLTIPSATVVSSTEAFISASTGLPTRIRPAQNLYFPIRTLNTTSSIAIGYIRIGTNGSINIFQDKDTDSPFGDLGTCGFFGMTISWHV